MTPVPNPWAERYSQLLSLDDEALRLKLEAPGSSQKALRYLTPSAAGEMLRRYLDAVYVPTCQALAVVRHLLGRAQAYALERYPSLHSFGQGIYEADLDFEPRPATAITGIAGVGKSHLVKAICRLLPDPDTLEIAGQLRVPLIAVARLSVGDKATERAQRSELLRQFGASAHEQQKSVTPGFVRRRAYIAGCGHILVDEMQFKNQGRASAAVTRNLLGLTYVGPPLAFVANFSLLHRLLKRNHEDWERLLSDVIVMTPEAPDSPELMQMIAQWRIVLSGTLDLAQDVTSEYLDDLSGGSRRAMRELLIVAFRSKLEVHRSGRLSAITARDIKAASRSQTLAAMSETTRLLRSQRKFGRPGDVRRVDLWCPIQAIDPQRSPYPDQVQNAAEVERSKAMDSAALRSQMTPAELKAEECARRLSGDELVSPASRRIQKTSNKATFDDLVSNVKTNRL